MGLNIGDLIRGIAPVAQVAGATVAGYKQDQDDAIKKLLQQEAAKRQAANDAIEQRVKLASIDPTVQGQLAKVKADAGVNAAVETARQTSPIKISEATQIGDAAATREQATHRANRAFDVANPEARFTTATIGGDPNVPGSGEVVAVNTATGQRGATIGTAKPNVSSAKLTEPQEKSYLFYNLMKNAEPQILGALQSNKIRPSAVSAYLSASQLGDVPILGKAIGAVAKPTANANLNEDEQKLIRAGKDFAAGVLRKESGAAVTASELMETMERYFPGMFGDKPGLTDAKNLARQQYMQTMEQEATPAMRYYNAQGGTKPPESHDPEFDALLARYKKP